MAFTNFLGHPSTLTIYSIIPSLPVTPAEAWSFGYFRCFQNMRQIGSFPQVFGAHIKKHMEEKNHLNVP